MYSRGYDTPEDEEAEEEDTDNGNSPTGLCQRLHQRGQEVIKKRVSIDANGFPYGIMKTFLEDDVKLLTKNLDPTAS